VARTDNRTSETNTVRKPNRWLCLFNVHHDAIKVIWEIHNGKLSLEEKPTTAGDHPAVEPRRYRMPDQPPTCPDGSPRTLAAQR
jgi:hypothetical protein